MDLCNENRERTLKVSLLLNFFKIQALFQGMKHIFSVATVNPAKGYTTLPETKYF